MGMRNKKCEWNAQQKQKNNEWKCGRRNVRRNKCGYIVKNWTCAITKNGDARQEAGNAWQKDGNS